MTDRTGHAESHRQVEAGQKDCGSGFRLTRRRFMLLSSSGVAATALGGVSGVAHALEPPRLLSLSVGYAKQTIPGDPEARRLVPAHHVGAADPRFAAGSANLDFMGLYPGGESRLLQKCEFFTVTADYRPFHDVQVPVFTYENRIVPNTGCMSDCTVPIDPEMGLNLYLEVIPKEGSGLSRERIPIHFSLDSDPGALKLRPGTYIIALAPLGMRFSPNWRSYELRCVDSAAGHAPSCGAVARRGELEDPSPGFEYLALNIGLPNAEGTA